MEIMIQMQNIFRDIFDNDSLVISEQTSAVDIDAWDSLNNIQLIVAIEHQFGIKFDSEEMTSWKNVGDMITCIKGKIQ
jgi:acyl carrier protein